MDLTERQPQWLLATIFLIVAWVVYKIDIVYTDQLNKIPGPWYAKWTNLRLKLAVITGSRMHYVHKMHKTYGPFVRLTPNEVGVADLEAFKQIHKVGSDFPKSSWYDDLVKFERPTLFVMSDAKMHATRRRLLARGFSKSYLRQTWEPLVRAKAVLTVQKMVEEAQQASAVDLLKWWTLMATDIATHLMFGKSFDMIEKGEKDTYIQTLEAALMGGGIGAELPAVRYIGRLVPTETCRKMFRANTFLMQYGQKAVRESIQRGESTNLFGKIIAEAGKGEAIDEVDVTHEATALIVAGSDTTGITLTYLIWAVLSRPQLCAALTEELSSLSENYNDQELEEKTLLNAVINETLRLYGAAPGSLPRSVPKEGVSLGDYYLRPGTTVSTQAYTIHRDGEIFVQPDTFDPSRFLGEKGKKEAGNAAFHPFGAGSRICLGLHLAQMELRLATSEFFRDFKNARLAARTTEQSMEMENFFLIAPKSHRCEVILD